MSAQVAACSVRAVLASADITLFVSQPQLVFQNEFALRLHTAWFSIHALQRQTPAVWLFYPMLYKVLV